MADPVRIGSFQNAVASLTPVTPIDGDLPATSTYNGTTVTTVTGGFLISLNGVADPGGGVLLEILFYVELTGGSAGSRFEAAIFGLRDSGVSDVFLGSHLLTVSPLVGAAMSANVPFSGKTVNACTQPIIDDDVSPTPPGARIVGNNAASQASIVIDALGFKKIVIAIAKGEYAAADIKVGVGTRLL